MLTLDRVSKRWLLTDRPVLDKFSTVFPSSGRTVIVGRSGCGKSTLLNVVAGLSGLDQGSIYLNGVESWRTKGSLVLLPQLPPLFPWHTVYNNLREAFRLIGREQDRQEIQRVIDTFELMPFLERQPHELSGGWRHMVAFAMVNLLSPMVLLLDEPLASVDTHRKTRLWKLLDARRYVSPQTLQLVVTHDLVEAVGIADTIFVCDGPPLRLLEIIKDVQLQDPCCTLDLVRGQLAAAESGYESWPRSV